MIRPKADLTPEEIEAKNEDSYEQLLSLIEDTQGQMALIIAACDSMAQRERIIKRYEADAWAEEKVRPFRIRLGQEPSLRSGLEALENEHPYLKEEGRAVVSVTGAELLLRVKITGEEKQTELEKFYGYLQWTREALRAFKYPVVLWVSREILRELSQRAPDFWSWRKAVVRFEAENGKSGFSPSIPLVQDCSEQSLNQLLQTARQPEDKIDLPPLEALMEEIEVLQIRDSDSYGLATLYEKLGQVYAQRIRHGESTAAIEERMAIDAFHQAIERYRSQSRWDSLATTLNRLVGFYIELSRFREALHLAQVAFNSAKQAKNSLEEMICLRHMGMINLLTGDIQKSISFCQNSLQISRTLVDQKGEASALGTLGLTYYCIGNFSEAISYHSQAFLIRRTILDKRGMANSLGNLGSVYSSIKDLKRAYILQSQSLKIHKEIKDKQGMATSLANLGILAASTDNFQEAINLYSQSLEIQEKIGSKKGMADCVNCLGRVYHAVGDTQKAVALYSRSLKIQQEIGYQRGVASALGNLGDVYILNKKFQEAISFYSESLEIRREIGHKGDIANSLACLGHTYDLIGDFQKTIDFYSLSLQIQQELHNMRGIANSLIGIGNAYFNLRCFQRSIDFYSQSLETYQKIEDHQGVADVLGNLGNAYFSLKDFQEAISFYSRSLKIEQEIGDQQGIANALGSLGNAYLSIGDFQKSIAFHSQSLEITQEIGDHNGEAISHFNLAIAQAKLNDPWSAKPNFERARAIFKALKLDHMAERCDVNLYQINQIIAKHPRRAPTIGDATPAPSPAETSTTNSETQVSRKPISPHLTLPIWAWFLIGLGLVILLAWLFG